MPAPVKVAPAPRLENPMKSTVAPLDMLNEPLLDPCSNWIVPTSANTVPMLLKERSRLVVPVPAVFRKAPVLLNTVIPPPRFEDHTPLKFVVNVPELLK